MQKQEALLLLYAVSASGIDEFPSSACPARCNGHGRCLGWQAQPDFPPMCLCDEFFDGLACAHRMLNPYAREHSTERPKHNTWERVAGVACGGDRHAPSCSACLSSSGIAGIIAGMMETESQLCAGECMLDAAKKCIKQPSYNPYEPSNRPAYFPYATGTLEEEKQKAAHRQHMQQRLQQMHPVERDKANAWRQRMVDLRRAGLAAGLARVPGTHMHNERPAHPTASAMVPRRSQAVRHQESAWVR